MTFKLAATTFSTKADETLKTVDAYTQDSAKTLNTLLPDINDKINLSGFSGLKGGNLGSGLDIFTKGKDLGFKASPDALLKGLVGSNSELSGALSSLTPGMRANLLKGGGPSNIMATVNGLQSKITGADLTTVKGLGELVRVVSRSNFPISFSDTSGMSNFATNIIRQASAAGIPNAFTAFSQGLDDSNIMNRVVKNLIPEVITTSNVNLMLNMATSPYGVNIKRFQPSFIKDFSRVFNMPKNTKQVNYRGILTNIERAYRAIDPLWGKAKRVATGPEVINMDDMGTCSRDMTKLLKANANSHYIPFPTNAPGTVNTSNTTTDLVKMNAMKDLFKASIGPKEEVISAPGFKKMDEDPQSCLRKDFPNLAWA